MEENHTSTDAHADTVYVPLHELLDSHDYERFINALRRREQSRQIPFGVPSQFLYPDGEVNYASLLGERPAEGG